MKKEKWYLKNSATIVRMDDIKEFTDLFVNYLDQFKEQMEINMIKFQQAQLNGVKPKLSPLAITIKDEDFEVIENKIRRKDSNKKLNLSVFLVSKSIEHKKVDFFIMNKTYHDKIVEENRKKEIDNCAKID